MPLTLAIGLAAALQAYQPVIMALVACSASVYARQPSCLTIDHVTRCDDGCNVTTCAQRSDVVWLHR